MIYPENFEDKCGFTELRERLYNNCIGDAGRFNVDKMRFNTNLKFVSESLDEVWEYLLLMRFEQRLDIAPYNEIAGVLKKLKHTGMILTVEEIEELYAVLANAPFIKNYFKNKAEDYPKLFIKSQNIDIPEELLTEIERICDFAGNIKSKASKELHSLRQAIESGRKRAGRIMESIAGKALTEGWMPADLSVTYVNGRTVIPLSATHKRKIKGYVHDESATGKTAYVEPAEMVEINNEIRNLELEEKREINRILKAFTAFAQSFRQEIIEIRSYIGFFDFTRSKALLADKLNGVKPILSEKPCMKLADARHPGLYIKSKESGIKLIPLNIELNPGKRILIISGPNAGGKSVALKTSALMQYMLQMGLLVPVEAHSEFSVFQKLFMDIGDEQSIDNDLSTYSSHLLNMKHFTEKANKNTLFFIDELGSGTEPHLGGAIAEAVLDTLKNRKSFGVVTTHYANIKDYASVTQGVENAAMLYNTEEMQPLYKLAEGKPGSSFAFEICKNIGLPQEVIKKASKKAGAKQVNIDKHLQDILKDKEAVSDKEKTLTKLEDELKRKIAKYEKLTEDLDSGMKKEIKAKKLELDNLIMMMNKKIENTIAGIKKSNAEKAKTQKLRGKLDDYKYLIEDRFDTEETKYTKKTTKKQEKVKPDVQAKKKTGNENTKLTIGDYVRFDDSDTVGKILELKGNKALIEIGALKMQVDAKRLIKTNKKASKTKTSTNVNVHLAEKQPTFTTSLDIRGKRADEATNLVMDFIDNAIVFNAAEVYILHGKGNGILRNLTRDVVKTFSKVTWYGDEHVDRGGSGITVVRF